MPNADIVSLVNYTGSIGFGQKYVEALMGRAGELDVKECYESAKHLVKLGIAREGPGKQFVQGGSHGGFLSAHRMCFHSTMFLPFYWSISSSDRAISRVLQCNGDT